jgi:hypothetical protein
MWAVAVDSEKERNTGNKYAQDDPNSCEDHKPNNCATGKMGMSLLCSSLRSYGRCMHICSIMQIALQVYSRGLQ